MKKTTVESKEKKTKEIEGLDAKIFDGKVNKAALYQVIKMYQANQRQGTADTKTRANVAGGGRKPWRQKGTGRARAGSIRSPLWRGGGTIFGPHPRDYFYTLPQKIRLEALRSSINSKNNENDLMVIDNLSIDKPKTKEFKSILSGLKLDKKALFVLDKIDEKLKLASRNLKEVALRQASDLNALDVLKYDKLVLTRPALSMITKRLTDGK